jgi:hypothetical protein
VLVVGDQDGTVYTPGYAQGDTIRVIGWTGKAVLDNRVARIDGSSQAEYYIVSLTGNSGGTVTISDSGGAEGYDELYVYGTPGDDQVYLNKTGTTSGSVIVGEMSGPLDINLTSGNVTVGAYSGHLARVNLTSGNVRMAATPQATGRLAVNATSGCARITGASHLDVRRRVTSGSLQIS